MMDIKEVLPPLIYKFFDIQSAGSGVVNNEIKQSLQLAEELHEPIKNEQFIQNLRIIFGVLI